MWQTEGPKEENKVWETLGAIESQSETLEWLVTMDNKLDKDMEAPPSDCRAADKVLTNILTIMNRTKASMAAAKGWKKEIMKLLEHIVEENKI